MNNMAVSNLSDATSTAAPEILASLSSKAQSIFGEALGGLPLVAFQTGGLGNFPYYYTDPVTANFNQLTYNWINNSLLNNNPPISQMSGSLFTNSFISVLSSVQYSLSQADQVTLNAALSNAQSQQLELIDTWQDTYPSLLAAGDNGSKIDELMNIICTSWASPPTTQSAIRSSKNLQNLLNNAPASGQTIMPALVNYVDALGDSVSLSDAQAMNTGYLESILDAVQNPTQENGGMLLSDNTGQYYPCYNITPSLGEVHNNLSATNNVIELTMDVSIQNDSEYSVSIEGGAAFSIPFADFFTLGVAGQSNYFHDQMVSNATSVSVKLTFTGVSMVNYAPAPYNESSNLYWYAIQPILDAIHNPEDVSGFHFSPAPAMDFSENGSFGILQGVAISNYPSVEITVTTTNNQAIQTTLTQATSASLSFLGIPLGGTSESTYTHSASSSSSDSSVTVSFSPPSESLAVLNVNSMAWVLGVQTYYPTA